MTWHLETERLVLRPMTHDDVDALAAVLGDPRSMRFYPQPFDPPSVERWVDRTLERYATDGYGLLAVVERGSGEVVGDCGPTRQAVDGEDFVELGWHVRSDRQGRGYATEAGVACRDHAWAALDPARLISLVRPENVPSWSVARALGFRPWRGTVRAGMAHVVWSLERDAASA
ncbi:MAG TPA: GNAT family N-acetyltransferase [Actinomycetota bacterium]|nr:GNAT family N-acetyltransferase [Actinomycetota bacterium]